MTAAQPWALLAFALAIPIVIAYLHRRRRLSKQVPSVLLLRAIAGQSKPTRRAWSRPRHLVSLLFVLLALASSAHDEETAGRSVPVERLAETARRCLRELT